MRQLPTLDELLAMPAVNLLALARERFAQAEHHAQAPVSHVGVSACPLPRAGDREVSYADMDGMTIDEGFAALKRIVRNKKDE